MFNILFHSEHLSLKDQTDEKIKEVCFKLCLLRKENKTKLSWVSPQTVIDYIFVSPKCHKRAQIYSTRVTITT